MAPRGAPRYTAGVRSVVYRYDDLRQLAEALELAFGQTLLAPRGANVRDGEWVLAMFELASSGRATAAAARGVLLDAGSALVFERRDFERLRQFATANPGQSSARMPAAPDAPASRSFAIEDGDPSETGETAAPILPVGPPPMPARDAPLRGRTAAYEIARDPEGRSTGPGGPPAPPPPDATPKPTAVVRRPEPPTATSGPVPRAQVLVVDDDPDLQEIVTAMLEAVGLAVEAVESAEEALARMESRRPDLLVLDWTLPGMSGLELCKRLRRDASCGALPILFLTAHAGTQDMVEAFAAGADDYVVKPFRAAELGARIFGLLRRTRVGARDRSP